MQLKYLVKWISMNLICFIKTADDEKENETTNLIIEDDFLLTNSFFNTEFIDERKMSQAGMSEKTNSKKLNDEVLIKKYDKNYNKEDETKNKCISLLIKKNDLDDDHQKYWIQENDELYAELKPPHFNYIRKIKKRINYDLILTNLNYLKDKKRSASPFLKYVYAPERLKKVCESKDPDFTLNQSFIFLDIFQKLKISSYKDLNTFKIIFQIVCEAIDDFMIYNIISYDVDFNTLRLVFNVIDCTKELMCLAYSDPDFLCFICKTNKIVSRDINDLALCYSFALIKNIFANNHLIPIYKFASFLSAIKFERSNDQQKFLKVKQKNGEKVTIDNVEYADYIFSHIFNLLTFIYDEIYNKV